MTYTPITRFHPQAFIVCRIMERRAIVKFLYDKHVPKDEIVEVLGNCRADRYFVTRWLQRLAKGSSISDKKRDGRPRTVRTKKLLKRVRQRYRRNPRRSVRSEAKKLKIARSTLHRAITRDLGFKAFKRCKRAGLTAAQKEKRLERCRILLRRFTDETVENIVFSDEKIFSIEQKLNAQNDRVYAAKLEDIPYHIRTVSQFAQSEGVMIWAAASANVKFPLVFVKKGVKIDADYYRREILDGTVNVWAPILLPDRNWTYQQDGAPAHTANITQDFCKDEFLDFIAKDEWPPSSPDANIFDYALFGELERRVNAREYHSRSELERELVRQWDNLEQSLVRKSVLGWRGRLRAIIRAKGGRIE